MGDTLPVNYVDIAVIGIIALNALIAYRRGLIMTIYRFTYLIINIVLTKMFYPVVSGFIIANTKLLEFFTEKISGILNLETLASKLSVGDMAGTINGLQLPEFIKQALVENNNYEVYNLLGVGEFGDYIATYLGKWTINILSMILVFIVVSIGIKIIVQFFDLVAKLPILNSLNKMSGLAIGVIMGVTMVWLLCVVINVFYTLDILQPVITMLESSSVAKWFYENNLLQLIFMSIIY